LIFILPVSPPGASAEKSRRSASPIPYYVSVDGNNKNNGMSVSTPFASVSRINSLILYPGDSVLFKCGDVWQADPLTITWSGSAGQPITFGSYPAGCANQPVLSGSLPVSGWALTGTANLYYAELSAGANAEKFPNGVNQVFRNGNRLTLGRWPNIEDPNFDNGYSTIENQTGSRQITDNQLPAGSWAGAIAHIRGMRWYILNRKVTNVTGQTINVEADLDCWDGCTNWGYFINNSLAAVDQDGEWFYDTSTHRLYIHSTGGIPAGIEASPVLKSGDQAGRFWGGITLGEDLLGEGVSYVNIENFSIQHWFRDGIALPTNFAHYEPHDVIIRNNTIQDVDSTGIRLMTWVYDAQDGRPDGWRGGYNMTVTGNVIERANRMGIDLQSRNSTFSNNTIRDIGIPQYLGASGLGCDLDDGGGMCTEDGDGIRVKVDRPADSGNTNNFSGNILERIAFNGIDVFGYNNTFTNNFIRQACFTKGDCGGIRTFGSENLGATAVHDLIFHGNILVEIPGNTDGCKAEFKDLFGFGLYIDNYSRDVVITANTITGASVAGILIQNSTASITDNTLYGNVSGTMYTGQVVITGSPSYVSGLQGNTLYSLQTIAWTLDADNRNRLGPSNNNYFFNPYQSRSIAVEGAHTLAEWRAFSGKDMNSTEAWFSLTPGTPPNSQLFFNDSAVTRTIDLGNILYNDLEQNPVFGQLILPPFESKVLVISGSLPDLALRMAAAGSTDTIPSSPVTYTLTVKNEGTSPASGIVLTNLVPTTIDELSWQSSAAGVSARSGSHYVWDLPDLASGAELTITISGKYIDSLIAGTPVATFAEVSTATPESTKGNNQAILWYGGWQKVYLPLVGE
jgi:uncharacterized repeat protein (TIGR01451 family)